MAHIVRPAWHSDALCKEHPEVDFFPGKGCDTTPARTICRQCMVTAECCAHALAEPERFGVWGGTSYRQRLNPERLTSSSAT